MNKLSIYLSKSNQCTWDDVALLRKKLMSLNCEISEHSGGKYDPGLMTQSEAVVVLAATRQQYVGRGQYDQIKLCEQVQKLNHKVFFVTHVDPSLVQVQVISGVSRYDEHDWNKYGKVETLQESIPLEIALSQNSPSGLTNLKKIEEAPNELPEF